MAKRNKKSNVSLKKSLQDERFPKLVGVFCLVLSLYCLLAFTSYIFTWKEDFDKAYWGALFNPQEVSNWLGRLGAIVSQTFFFYGFGLSSFIFVFVLFQTGMRLIGGESFKALFPFYRQWTITALWTSCVFAFVFQSSEFPFGGAFGRYLTEILLSFLGIVGVLLMLGFIFLVILIWVRNPNLRAVTPEGLRNWLLQTPLIIFLQQLLQSSRQRYLAAEAREREIESEEAAAATTEQEEKNKQQAQAPEKSEDSPTQPEEPQPNQDLPPPLDPRIVPTRQELEERLHRLTQGQLGFDPPRLNPNNNQETPEPSLQQNQDQDEENGLDLEVQTSQNLEPELNITSENPHHLEPYDPTLDLPRFEQPVLDLLEDYSKEKIIIDHSELEANKEQIIETLLNYKIEIVRIMATIGPTVTLYEIVPAPGVRISRIKSLEDDIALSLAALGIRIIAPIPGKGTIGIEVPNRKKQTVALKEVLASKKFKEAKMDLPIALGKTISNEVFIADLAKMPHLLIAGATGQGKSVGINTLIMSLLYKKHPSQIKLVLIDPKKVELSLYNKLANHFLAFLPGEEEAIVTDTSKVVQTLHSLTVEMDMRYDLLKKAGVRNITEYNQKFVKRSLLPTEGHRFLPFLVLIIDEFADMIMTAGKEVELPIGRLAQLARAVGIHLIIATQRPSVNIITGVIKANFPARLAFRVASKIDSRTILDTGGADQLIGRGDMLLYSGSDTVRIQCAYVDTHEVERVIDHISEQNGYPEPFYLPAYGDEAGSGNDYNETLMDLDDFFEDAARLMVATQQGSTSMIQRRLKLGFNRAGRIMDQLEVMGIVGPPEGSKARQVYIQEETELDEFLKNLREKRARLR